MDEIIKFKTAMLIYQSIQERRNYQPCCLIKAWRALKGICSWIYLKTYTRIHEPEEYRLFYANNYATNIIENMYDDSAIARLEALYESL